jgi:iron complex outermembrane receptor protein
LGYSINNRVPTASEIECSDPARPCLLPSSLAGDPPNLRQVIAHTAEIGARGKFSLPFAGVKMNWNASAFRTDADDDIYGVATSASTGFFENVGATRRQGFETMLELQADRWDVYMQYSYIEATFRSDLVLNSPSNPFQDADGNIDVNVGSRLPLIPAGRLKMGVDVQPLPNLTVGATLNLVTASYYRGDESNQNPQLPGYHVVGLRASYRPVKGLEVFAAVQNLFDERYSTYGLYSDPTGVGAPGIPADADSNDPGVDNRFQSPAMPRAYFAGIRLSF